ERSRITAEREWRRSLERSHKADPRRRTRARPADVARLGAAVECLSSMPPVGETIAMITEQDARRLREADAALRWLTEFAIAWDGARTDDNPRRLRTVSA